VLHVFDDSDKVISAAADFFAEQSAKYILESGRYSVALSGGSSPKKLFELLATEPYRTKIEWEKIFFFMGDERFVPLDDPQSNFLMAQNSLFTPLGIPVDHVFPVNTKVSPEDAAKQYEQTLRKHFAGECRFDLIWLGLGDDAHTASLFPHTEVLTETKALVKEVFVKKVNQYRITFTQTLINNASTVAFLTYGASKADAVFHIMKDTYNPTEYPAQLVKPMSGKLHWFIDKSAALKAM
jgi:6-phosphogluconolactonase